jgi:hypothetical protein
MAFIGTALAAASIGSSIYGASQAKSAANKQKDLINSMTYQPIDLNALQQQAQQNAQQNLANSIKLEQQYFPQAAAARAGTQNLVAQQVAQGGRLTPDVSNAVTRAAMASGGAGGFGAGPLAAANLGLTAQGQINNAIGLGQNLTQTEMAGLPTSGLDPGALASAAIGQNQQQNQFNLSKAGLLSNNLQSQAEANSAMGAAIGNGLTSAIGGVQNYLNSPSVPKLPNNLANAFTSGAFAPNATLGNTSLTFANLPTAGGFGNMAPFSGGNLSAISTTTPTFVNPFLGKP